jgi:cell division protein FtsB
MSSLILLGMLALAIGGEKGFLTLWRMEREVERLAEEVRDIEQENSDLQREVWRLQHDMAYVERLARQELGFVRQGEIVFEFIE